MEAEPGNVSISTAHWRARRVSTPARSPAAPRSVQPEEARVSRWRERHYARAQRAGDAAAAQDLVLDVLVLLSVGMFLVLATGVGILVLRSALGS
jgi:hypothetical protein